MSSRSILLSTAAAGVTLTAAVLLPTSANSATTPAPPAGTIASATWDASTDHSPQLVGGETTPLGQFTYRQDEDVADLNDVTVNGTVTGLTPNASYVTVLYIDPVCLPTPSVTAFPSAIFKADSTGRAVLRNLPLNPQALNALRTFDIADTRSVSIRDVLLPGQTIGGVPITVPTIPNAAETEACDASPFVN